MSQQDIITAEKEAVKDVTEAKKPGKDANQTMFEEIRSEQDKQKNNPEALNAYMKAFTQKAIEDGLIQPMQIVDYMDTHKDLLGKSKDAIEQEAAKSPEAKDKLMLSSISFVYENLKKVKSNDDQSGISQDDVTEAKRMETDKIKSEENRRALAEKLQIQPDTQLKGGTTLYDVARQKLEYMHSANPEQNTKPTQQDIFGEVAKMMKRSDTENKFTVLKEEDAKKGLQRSIPKDWDNLTSKITLKVFTEAELKQLQERKENPNSKKSEEDKSKDSTTPGTSDKKTTTPQETSEADKRNDKSDPKVQLITEAEMQKTLKNGQTRTVSLDNGDKGARTITYKEGEKDVQVLTRKDDGTWSSKSGEGAEVPVKVTFDKGNLTVEESPTKKRIDYKNGAVLQLDGAKQTISTEDGHIYQTTDGSTWTVDGKASPEKATINAEGKVTRELINKNELTLNSDEVLRGHEYFVKHYDEINQKDGYVTDSDIRAYVAKTNDLSPAERKYLNFVANRAYSDIEDKNDDETFLENDGITKLDITNWTQEKLFKAGKGDQLVLAPTLDQEQQKKAESFIASHSKEMNTKDGNGVSDTVISLREIEDYLYAHKNDNTVSAEEKALMKSYMASENEKMRQYVVQNWEKINTNNDGEISANEIAEFAALHPEQQAALQKLKSDVERQKKSHNGRLAGQHNDQWGTDDQGLTVYDLVNETYRLTDS